MGGKKKGKGKKGDDKPKEEPKIIIPDYIPHEIGPLPISVKVYHLQDLYIIYTDEYAQSGEIKQTLSNLCGQPVEEIRLYLKNKRPIEDVSTNSLDRTKKLTTPIRILRQHLI